MNNIGWQKITASADLSNIFSKAKSHRMGKWCVSFHGLSIYCHDILSFYMAAKDIFLNRIYDFTSSKQKPRIIDGGGHIGLFTLFVKQRYPGAQITVFEPDEESLQLLKYNLDANGATDVMVVKAGLYSHVGKLPFGSDHSDGSSLFLEDKNTNVNVVCLSHYIDSEIDFLKLNVEGAELSVLTEIESKLPLIKEMVIEYHGFPEIGQNLHKILTILNRAGFRYLIHDFDVETNPATKPPFKLETNTRYFLLIYAKRLFPSEQRNAVFNRTGNSKYPQPISRLFGFDRGTPIDRYYIEKYLEQNKSYIRGSVLEIGNNFYTQKYGSGVTKSDVLNAVTSPNATIVGDFATGENIPEFAFDCIIMTQTIQMIYNVKAALENAIKALKPGGTLLITASGISQISRYDMDRWGEYWRFTDISLKMLLSEFVPGDAVCVESFGNVAVAKAFLDGLATHELPQEVLDYRDNDYQVLLTARVKKPEKMLLMEPIRHKIQESQTSVFAPMVLLYHRISNDPIDAQLLTVSPENFEAHLKELSGNYRVVPLHQLLEEIRQEKFNAGTIALTFDDGYLDNLTNAVPLLEKYGLHATIFITSGMVGSEEEFWWDQLERIFLTGEPLPESLNITTSEGIKEWNLTKAEWRLKALDELGNILRGKSYKKISQFINNLFEQTGITKEARHTHRVVNVEQLKELSLSPSIEIGSHAVTHTRLSILSLEEQRLEIRESKRYLESIIQKPVRLFSYPFGTPDDFTTDTERMVKEEGYEAGIANVQGYVTKPVNAYSISRHLVRNWHREIFAKWLKYEDKGNLESQTISTRANRLVAYQIKQRLHCNQLHQTQTSVGSTNNTSRKGLPKVLLWTVHRSGTHWLADMLSDIMGIPWGYNSIDGNDYKEETIKQLYSHSDDKILVRHMCLSPHELFKHPDSLGIRIILLYRDPRDVIASSVNMRKYKEGYRKGLPPFPDMSISEILKYEIQTYTNYFKHDLPKWVEVDYTNLFKVKYEDLLKETTVTLEAIAKFLSLNINRAVLEQIVRKHDFKTSTNRQKGVENKKEHNRKGIIGDYKNQFSMDEQRMLTDLLSDVLIKMGYVL